MSKFVIYPVPSGYRFELKAPNGEGIALSEVYDTVAACRKGIASVRKNAAAAKLEDSTDPASPGKTNPKFQLYQDRSGEYRFRLKARNGEIIAVSDDYCTKAGCLNGIESVRKNAAEAEIMEE